MKYRILKKGELIREGDECFQPSLNCWEPTMQIKKMVGETRRVGITVAMDFSRAIYRRPLKAKVVAKPAHNSGSRATL